MTIEEAFKNDGFIVFDHATRNGVAGYVAKNPLAINHLDGKPKLAYYLEGSAKDMGWQMGRMAHHEVKQMVMHFPYAVITGFLDPKMDEALKILIVVIVYSILLSKLDSVTKDVPQAYIDEAKGIVEGVHSINPFALEVTFETVWVLNVGFDILQALLSDPLKLFGEINSHPLALEKNILVNEKGFHIPHFCNAYSAFNDKTHFFGRDWMFNGGDVLENCAALIITKPDDGRKPLVYAAAPGLVGAALAMNIDGIAMGVDMVSAANSNYAEPGFNSLLLVRDCIHKSDSAKAVVQNAKNANRGAVFIYPVSDGKNNTACVVEAGMKTKNLDPLSYVPDWLKKYLPTKEDLEKNAEKPEEGLIARWKDYDQGKYFIDTYNENIFKAFSKKYNPDVWGKEGFVFNKVYNDSNTFGLMYFYPLRQNLSKDNSESLMANLKKGDWQFQLVTNAWLSPYMNICSMSLWASILSQPFWSDIQWRYDLLNETLIANQHNELEWNNAWKMINFLSPVIGEGPGKDYYKIDGAPWKLPIVAYHDDHGKPQQTWRVDGMTNLCELNEKKVRSLYGTYADKYVEITLPNYV